MAEEDSTTNPSKTVVTVIGASPSRRPTSEACLVVMYGEPLGKRVPLGSAAIHVGRSSKCEIHLDQESVSRTHCRVSYDGRGYRIKDLGSTNGTYVNDEPIEEVTLRDGDQIKVGRTILKFIMGGHIEAQYHEEIYRLMTIDGLTEVNNKRYFEEMLEREISRSQRYDRAFCVVLFDIDHFKQVNDTHGHLAGDAVLRKLGALVKKRVRRDDIVARLGGEEFGILIPEATAERGVGVAEKLREAVAEAHFEFEGTSLSITISLGVAEWNEGLRDTKDLLRLADEKLYEAKRTGRNRVCS